MSDGARCPACDHADWRPIGDFMLQGDYWFFASAKTKEPVIMHVNDNLMCHWHGEGTYDNFTISNLRTKFPHAVIRRIAPLPPPSAYLEDKVADLQQTIDKMKEELAARVQLAFEMEVKAAALADERSDLVKALDAIEAELLARLVRRGESGDLAQAIRILRNEANLDLGNRVRSCLFIAAIPC